MGSVVADKFQRARVVARHDLNLAVGNGIGEIAQVSIQCDGDRLLGQGFGNALGSTDGFGILAAASICPIVAVLTLGIYVQFKVKREERRIARELALEGETK